ncbi:hypothetical protein [Streptococcus uberis]|uniref:hypothetical protein n=1 Tax=Streptococcus uberis TaxID=1349 RepID=UPI001FF4A58F|nr:hypothetical protein [Streptococcus uberis]MCK1222743.1 hypothetical protein [Streptococcus uberis]
MVYSDLERRLIAGEEYTDYDVDATVTIGKQETYKEIGTVREVVTDDFGQKAYVIQSEDKKEVSVIYRGSDVPGAKGSAVDWLGNDFIFTCKNKSVS